MISNIEHCFDGVMADVYICHGPATLEKSEREQLAVELLASVYHLIRKDFNSHIEFVHFVMDQYE
jgi:hypothetical protein